jgi:hypothetical protein
MKIILIPLTALFLTLNFEAHSQVDNDSSSDRFGNKSSEYNQLLKKSHNQKVTATIMGISGGVICLTGIGLAVSSLNGLFDLNVHHNDYGSAPDILGIGGAILVIAAIPFAIAAKQNKHKAMLYMQKENVMATPGIKNTELVSIGIRIRL